MSLERKKTLNVFRDAKSAWGSFDDFPVGPRGTDPMPHLSRNRVAQPFYVVGEADHVLIHMAGRGELWLREAQVTRMDLVPGDAVYIPAGVASRIIPQGEALQIRLKPEPPAREAVAWFCEGCGALVHTRELEAGIVQAQYLAAVEAFNADTALRRCAECGRLHPAADLGDIAWAEVAAAIAAEDAS